MDWVFLIGRVIYGAVFVYYGLRHFVFLRDVAAYAAYKNVPAPQAAAIVSGLMMLLGGLSIILGFWPVVGSILLIVFLVVAAVMVHNFWTHTDATARANDLAHFMKNLALAGTALALMGIPTPWPLSLGG